MLDRDRRGATADHEAGHVAAAIVLGFVFVSVEIGPYPAVVGLHRDREPLDDPDPLDKDAMRRWLDDVELRAWRADRDRAIIARCGALAGGTRWEAPSNAADRRIVYEAPIRVPLVRWCDFIEDEAREVAASASFWRVQARVSQALAVDESLSYADVEALIG